MLSIFSLTVVGSIFTAIPIVALGHQAINEDISTNGFENYYDSTVSEIRTVRSATQPRSFATVDRLIEELDSQITELEETLADLNKVFSGYSTNLDRKAHNVDRECGNRISETGQNRAKWTLEREGFSIEKFCKKHLSKEFQERYTRKPRSNVTIPDDFYCIPQMDKPTDEAVEVLKCYCVAKFYPDQLD